MPCKITFGQDNSFIAKSSMVLNCLKNLVTAAGKILFNGCWNSVEDNSFIAKSSMVLNHLKNLVTAAGKILFNGCWNSVAKWKFPTVASSLAFISLIYRYSRLKQVNPVKYGIFGAVAICLAVKYTEPHKVPSITQSFQTYQFSHSDFLTAEASILSEINFELTVPTVYTFLVYLFKDFNIPSQMRILATDLLLEMVKHFDDTDTGSFE